MASKATHIEFLLSQVRNSVGNLAGGTVTIAAAGDATSAPITIWLDRNKATPAANPYTLDANGTAQLYADGLIKVVLKNAAGSTVYTRDNLNYVDYLTSGSYQALDADYASLNAAITAIGATPTTLTIRTAAFSMTGAATIPATLSIKIEYPGSIANSTYTLNVNGPFSAPLTQVFTGTGAVTFGTGQTVRPEWWGAVGDWNGSAGTDNTVAIQAAANASKNVKFRRKGYKVTDEIILNPTTMGGNGGWNLIGEGNANSVTTGTYLYQATASKAIFKIGDVSGLLVDQQTHISDIGFTGVATGIGVWLAITEDTVIERCKFSGLDKGVQLATTASCEAIRPKILNSLFAGLNYGIFGQNTTNRDVWVENNTFRNNKVGDIHLAGNADGGYIVNNFAGQDDPSVTTTSTWLYLQSPIWYNIEGNHFYNCALAGANLLSPRHCTITGNQFYGASQQDRTTAALAFTSMANGTQIFGNTVDNNIFYKNYGFGFTSTIGSNYDEITNNRFFATGHLASSKVQDAIAITDMANGLIADNVIDGATPDTYATITTTAGSVDATVASQTGDDIAVGMSITGKGILPNTTIATADAAVLAGGGGAITLSQAANLAATSENFVLGTIYTRYPMNIATTSNTKILNNVVNNCVNALPYYTGNRSLSVKGNTQPVYYTTTATANVDDELIYVTAASGWTLTLQSAVLYKDKEITIVKTDNNANVITVAGGGVNINGAATYTGLSAQYKYLRVKGDGVQWWITGSN